MAADCLPDPASIQVACDRCTQGVMDTTNPHLTGECGCECHSPVSAAVPPAEPPEGDLDPANWIDGCPTYCKTRSSASCGKCGGDLSQCPHYGYMERKRQAEDRAAADPSVSPAEPPEDETLHALRRSLLDAMSAWSEDNWCAGWMSGTEEMLHERGSIWEILGRAVGWPTGYEHDADFRWVTWDEAGAIFAERKVTRGR